MFSSLFSFGSTILRCTNKHPFIHVPPTCLLLWCTAPGGWCLLAPLQVVWSVPSSSSSTELCWVLAWDWWCCSRLQPVSSICFISQTSIGSGGNAGRCWRALPSNRGESLHLQVLFTKSLRGGAPSATTAIINLTRLVFQGESGLWKGKTFLRDGNS